MPKATKKKAPVKKSSPGHTAPLTLTREFYQALYVASVGKSFKATELDTGHRAFRGLKSRGKQFTRMMILERLNAAGTAGEHLKADGYGKGRSYSWVNVQQDWKDALDHARSVDDIRSAAAKKAHETRKQKEAAADNGGNGGSADASGAGTEAVSSDPVDALLAQRRREADLIRMVVANGKRLVVEALEPLLEQLRADAHLAEQVAYTILKELADDAAPTK